MSRLIATVLGVGYLRPASGTWASAVAVMVGWGISLWVGFPALVVATLAATAVGFWACARELAGKPGEDPSEIVIDEIAGQWLALCFPAMGFWMRGADMVWPGPLAAFLLFRLFDIWKPGIIGRADRRGDPAGVMIDDLWAGLFAGIGTVILAAAYHGPMIFSRVMGG